MSIRLRLTLLYTAVLAITLVVFGIVLYLRLDRNLHTEIDRSLRDRADRETQIATAPPRGTPPRPGRGLELGAVVLGDPAIFQQIRGGNGQICFSTPNQGEEALPAPKSAAPQHFEDTTVKDVHLRVLVRPVPAEQLRFNAQNGCIPPYTELLARSLTDVDNTLSRLRFVLLLGTAAAVATAGAAGWLLARNALRPIDRLTAEAAGIGRRQDFERRVQHDGPNDEVGRLAGTFNEMLDGLSAAHERLRVALDAQRRFVADASHELRTPLTTIRGNVELLRLEEDVAGSPDQQEALSDIATEAERMSRLVNNLLALARADGGMHIQRHPVEVKPVVDEVFQKAARLADHVDLRLGERANVSVLGDRDYLVQLLFILVDNALKYTPSGVVTIAATCAGGMLRLSVSDTGVGIAPHDQRRIFDRFYRSDLSRHGEGTGLGLSIARWIAEELGGTIELRSELNRGSTFTLVLPAIAGTADAPTRSTALAAGA